MLPHKAVITPFYGTLYSPIPIPHHTYPFLQPTPTNWHLPPPTILPTPISLTSRLDARNIRHRSLTSNDHVCVGGGGFGGGAEAQRRRGCKKSWCKKPQNVDAIGNKTKPGMCDIFFGKYARRCKTRHHLKSAQRREMWKHFRQCFGSGFGIWIRIKKSKSQIIKSKFCFLVTFKTFF